MKHIDDRTLALLALDEPDDEWSREHLAGCARCRDELAAYQRVTRAARAGSGSAGMETPANAVWEGIREELNLPGPRDEVEASATVSPPETTRRRWRRRTVWIVAASFLAGAGASAGLNYLLEPAPPPQRTVASAELEPLPGWQDTGTAVLREVDGHQVLSVNLTGEDATGFREVWLIDADLERLISLGVLVGDSGEFAVPSGADASEFPIVDVSAEPYDGDPAHSGDSIVRGEFR